MNKKKWTSTDKWLIALQIASVVVSIIIALIPDNVITSSIKMTIICCCIGIPIIVVQISLTVDSNKIESTIEKQEETITQSNLLTQQTVELFQIYSSKNERVRRFAERRIDETIKFLNKANQMGSSGLLEVGEYYNELDYLADKLEQDNGGNCLIWAMTGFAPDEWSSNGGYEKAWTSRLNVLANRQIKTIRLCFISDELLSQIKDENFIPQPKSERGTSLDGLISLLEQYYKENNPNREHYVLLNNEFTVLEEKKGFFGIVLSNNEKHVIEGEAVNLDNGLTGKVLFNNNDIEELYIVFEHACQHDREIIKFINDNASQKFKDFLVKKEILL